MGWDGGGVVLCPALPCSGVDSEGWPIAANYRHACIRFAPTDQPGACSAVHPRASFTRRKAHLIKKNHPDLIDFTIATTRAPARGTHCSAEHCTLTCSQPKLPPPTLLFRPCYGCSALFLSTGLFHKTGLYLPFPSPNSRGPTMTVSNARECRYFPGAARSGTGECGPSDHKSVIMARDLDISQRQAAAKGYSCPIYVDGEGSKWFPPCLWAVRDAPQPRLSSRAGGT